MLFSDLSAAIPPSFRNFSAGVYDARARDKGDTRGIDKVGSIRGSADVMSTTSQRRTIRLYAAFLKVPRGDRRTGSLLTSALSIGKTLTRHPIEIRTKKDGGLCKQPTAQHVHDVDDGNATQGMANVGFQSVR